MKAQLKLKQTQQLQLSPQLQQSIKLLHMSTLELDEVVSQALLDNPLLERVEAVEPDWSEAEAASEHAITAALGSSARYEFRDDDDAFAGIAEEVDFRQALQQQVCEQDLTAQEAFAVRVLIENLDEHGYLSGTLEDIAEHAPLEWLLDEAGLAHALQCLQRFDPPGVAARDLQESLLLQLKRLPESPVALIAVIAVQQHFELLSQAGVLGKLKKRMAQPEAKLQQALDLIASLNPYPNSGWDSDEPTYFVSPDVWVEHKKGRWQVRLNEAAQPQVCLNEAYVEWVQECDSPQLREQVQAAKSLLGSLAMRSDTIARVAAYIVQKQQAFFDQGAVALVPMSLKEVAEHLDVHESTISRTVNQKYLGCPQGVLELRSFFTQAVGEEAAGGGISNASIKAQLAQLIEAEDKSRPHSDEALQQLLAEQGIQVARRTVAKYREALRLAPAHQRRQG